VAASTLLWCVAWWCGGWKETNGASVGMRLLHPPVQRKAEEDGLTTLQARQGGEVGRRGRSSGAGVMAGRFF
jgi:hypothetical protein